MASLAPSSYLSRSSSSSCSSSSSLASSSLSSLDYKSSRRRTLPQRGQVTAAIFASIFAAIARWLSGEEPADSQTRVEEDGAGPSMSDLRPDIEQGGPVSGSSQSDSKGSGLSGWSLHGLNSSGSAAQSCPQSESLECSHSFDEGIQGKS